MDHRRKVHGDHPGELVIGHLDRVVDAVMERVWTGRADRGLEGVEDHVVGLGADGVDRDLPARLVRATDGLGQSSGSQLKIVPQPLSSVIFRPRTRSRSVTGPGVRSVYQSPKWAPSFGSFSAR